MSNHITIELCQEDRTLLKNLTAALGLVADIEEAKLRVTVGKPEPDNIQQKLAETLNRVKESPENATEATKAEPLTTEPITEEKPTEATDAPAEEAKPTVTLEQIQQKVVQLAAANGEALKAKVREIVNTYATKVSDIPEDKWAECWTRLCDLK